VDDIDVVVIGPVSIDFNTENGGCASNTWVLPMSFNVNQTCFAVRRGSDVRTERAVLLDVADDLMIATVNNDRSGLNEEQT